MTDEFGLQIDFIQSGQWGTGCVRHFSVLHFSDPLLQKIQHPTWLNVAPNLRNRDTVLERDSCHASRNVNGNAETSGNQDRKMEDRKIAT